MITTRELPEKGKDFIDAMVPMLESLVDFDSYGYEHYLKEGSFCPDPQGNP